MNNVDTRSTFHIGFGLRVNVRATKCAAWPAPTTTSIRQFIPFLPKSPIFNLNLLFTTLASPSPSPEAKTPDISQLKDSSAVLRQWGCSEPDISNILQLIPSIRRMKLATLQSKLRVLGDFGVNSSDLVKIVTCRPRFLNSRIDRFLDERLQYLRDLFQSEETLRKAIVRNPSLLIYDFHKQIKPVVSFYEQMGVGKHDLIAMLISRPTLIPRSSLDDVKLDFIRRTGVEKGCKLYKYVVTIFAISRVETVLEKVANFEKFGFTEDEIFGLFGRAPLLLTLSIDKVQRNMTFVLGIMKLNASVVLRYPFLIFSNLEGVIKPRFLLGGKIDDLGLEPQIKGPSLLRALRMTEKRFFKVFVDCHPKDVAKELTAFYKTTKYIRRLAESSKKNARKGFPY
nr:transcription termination factor MTEF1, chloroplastic [Ipomoea trifida]